MNEALFNLFGDLMLSKIAYGGNSTMPTLDLENDICRYLSLQAREDVHLMMVFATMVCDAYHDFEVKSPHALWQCHFCTVERFCNRYASRREVMDLLEMHAGDLLHLLHKRFFPDNEIATSMPEVLKTAFLKDIQSILYFAQKKFA